MTKQLHVGVVNDLKMAIDSLEKKIEKVQNGEPVLEK